MGRLAYSERFAQPASYPTRRVGRDLAACIVLLVLKELARRIRGPVDRVMSRVQPIPLVALKL